MKPTPPAIHNAFDILEAFQDGQREFTAQEFHKKLNISLSTQYRVLHALEDRGYLRRDTQTGRYRLGFKFLQVGNLALEQEEIVETSRGILQDMCDETKETIQLGILEGVEVLYIKTIESPLPLRYVLQPGFRTPSYCVAAGKAILAYESEDKISRVIRAGLRRFTKKTICTATALKRELADVRRGGYAVNWGEMRKSGRGVYAPVFDYSGRVAAAVGLSVPPERFTHKRLPSLAEVVRRCAEEISSRLGAVPLKTSATTGENEAASLAEAPIRSKQRGGSNRKPEKSGRKNDTSG
ncbi:MAG: IclR family transcriptional regulator [Nitrospinota bacterium]|nr:IclR family transcriptional regulator [Nitrospinota bacterium]MDP7169070.1 IclR family transcriptional regulator [Nitrospinota bacterium]MDP7505487.1 IclR family transcriptional regulator [Nitrospinota bacterium]